MSFPRTAQGRTVETPPETSYDVWVQSADKNGVTYWHQYPHERASTAQNAIDAVLERCGGLIGYGDYTPRIAIAYSVVPGVRVTYALERKPRAEWQRVMPLGNPYD